MKKLTQYLGLSLLLFSSNIWAEYRVYQYSVSQKNYYELDPEPYLTTSTLDPVSFIAYNGGSNSIKVDLIRTWRCFGHTGRLKPLCPSPFERAKMLGEF